MKYYHLAAKDNFFYVCDYCEKDDGRDTFVWKSLPKRKGHFVICYKCIKKIYEQNRESIYGK